MKQDIRDKRFYQLQKKDPSQLTPEEIREYVEYCDGKIDSIKFNKARKSWIIAKKEMEEKLKIQQFELDKDNDTSITDLKTDTGKEVQKTNKKKSQIMFIEYKGDSLAGPGRIGRVRFSKTEKSIYYNEHTLQSSKGTKSNYVDIETGEKYWISGCKKHGDDTLYPGIIEIDEDVREEYWNEIRNQPDNAHLTSFRSEGKYSKRKPK